MKVGIMGGTFDPIHLGHLIAAESARVEAGLDEVWFMPSNVPPHKANAPLATTAQRWEMLELAIAGHPSFRSEAIELKRGGTSYTIDTVKELQRLHPGIQFHFIIGGDMVQYLPRWMNIEELAGLIRFIGLERPGYPLQLEQLPPQLAEAVIPAEMPSVEISSTDIRKRRSEGRSIRYLVPDAVNQYIGENRIYES